MPQTRPNKVKTPTNSDAYNLTGDLATMADSANVIIPVASQAERDGLTATSGMVVIRTDVTGAPLEKWDGAKWCRSGPLTFKFSRGAGSDSTFTSANTALTSGTITAALPGLWRVEGYCGLYGSTSAVGRTFVSTGASPTYYKTRQDLTGTPSTYVVPPVFYTHTGGDLAIAVGYDVTSGTASVMSAASGDTAVLATFMGS